MSRLSDRLKKQGYGGKTVKEMAEQAAARNAASPAQPPRTPLAEPAVSDFFPLKTSEGKCARLSMPGMVEEAIQEHFLLISHLAANPLEATKDKSPEILEIEPFVCRELIIYPAQDTAFGTKIKFTSDQHSFHLDIPKQFQGKTGSALVLPFTFFTDGQPSFRYELKGKSSYKLHITDESLIAVIEDFPQERGWYSTEPKFGIPTGARLSAGASGFKDPDKRYLCRLDSLNGSDMQYFGLLVLGHSYDLLADLSLYAVGADLSPLYSYSALVYGPKQMEDAK